MKWIESVCNNSYIVFQIELLSRTFIAGLLGCMIGYERKNRDKSAGMRTHAIVCLGAALMMIVSKYCFDDVVKYDASRVAAQIVSGVGFLGTGMIFVKNNTVSGLTTAAGVWTTAGIGMAIGSGAYFLGISAGLLVVIVQILLHKVSFISFEPVRGYIKIVTDYYEDVLKDIQKEIRRKKIKMLNCKVSKQKDGVRLELTLFFHSDEMKNEFMLNWAKDERISEISG